MIEVFGKQFPDNGPIIGFCATSMHTIGRHLRFVCSSQRFSKYSGAQARYSPSIVLHRFHVKQTVGGDL